MNSSDYIVELLIQNGIEIMFSFTGGAISHLLDGVFRRHLKDKSITPICVMHEQAGSMMLDGYTRATGKLGAMAVTSGPGATNLITGIACSYYDSIPGLYFTGQVRTWEFKYESKQRQVGFQETDIVSVIKPITKYAVMIDRVEDIRYEIEKAIHIATNGRPGPVLIDLPMDMQWAEIDPDKMVGYKPNEKKPEPDDRIKWKIKLCADWVRKAKKPMIISGGGIRNAGGVADFRKLANHMKMPVSISFGAKDSFPHDSDLFAGLVGPVGNGATNKSIHDSDLVLAIGSRLSWRQIKMNPDDFVPNGKIVQVDIDPAEMNQRVKTDLTLAMDVKEFMIKLYEQLKDEKLDYGGWTKKVRKAYLDNPYNLVDVKYKKDDISPYKFFDELSRQMGDSDILIADAGQNIMYAMQGFNVRANQRVFTAHAHSPMGYSFPAAMGPALVYKGKPNVVCTIGDGGFNLNVQEFQTMKEYGIAVKVFILDNNSYGAIMDYQDSKLGGVYFASSNEYGYVPPDFLAIVKAYKIPTAKITNPKDIGKKIKNVIDHEGPIVCHVRLPNRTYVKFD